MKEYNSIQIFACDHRSNIFWPFPFIRIGTGYNTDALIKDTIGKSITEKFDVLLSEGTAIWWIWKHLAEFGNPDLVGFCHYRRFFTKRIPNYGIFPIYSASEKNIDAELPYIVSPTNVLDTLRLNDADMILPAKFPDYSYQKNCTNLQQLMLAESNAFGFGFNEELCNAAFEILNNVAKRYVNQSIQYTFNDLNGYHFNMFVMKKQLFDIYCKILFDASFEVAKYVEDKNITNLHQRWLSYLLERYSSCIFKYFQSKNKKTIELPIIMFEKQKYK